MTQDHLINDPCLKCHRLDVIVELETYRRHVADLERWLTEARAKNTKLGKEIKLALKESIAEPISFKAREIQRCLDEWQPRHNCANCKNARVSGNPDWPSARCDRNYGEPIELHRLIRPKQPRGWRLASQCGEYEGLSDE